ncbi:MAG TPA: hypothetical protein VNE39_10795 [Planctomycetota bacterium]|nr:hypothetical protein [Planctomycetota bacterium]
MEEVPSEASQTPQPPREERKELIKLDFRRRPQREGSGGPRRALVWGGLVASLVLMFAGTLVTMVARQRWGLFLFLAAALLYLFCRCMTIGVLNTAPKAFSVVLLVAGAFILSRWPAVSAMGILGIACLGGALALVLVGGFGGAPRAGSRPQRRDGPS